MSSVIVVFLWLVLSPAVSAEPVASEFGDIERLRDPGFYRNAAKNEYSFDWLDIYDPLEPLNKRIYAFNSVFDHYVYLPALRGYHFVFPEFVTDRFTDFWNNLDDVPTFYNSLLQFKIEKAAITFWRLLTNTTVGLAGLWDPATHWLALQDQDEDFGQTLGFWGVAQGPYLVIPIYGPSNFRDGFGELADWGAQIEIDFLGVKGAEWNGDTKGWTIFAFDALDRRDAEPFRYGELGSPFEYEKVRFLISKERQLLVEE